MMHRLRAGLSPALAALLFALLSLAMLPYPGLQDDEVAFARPLYSSVWYSVTVHGKQLPLMVVSYAGALKTWLYAAIFAFFEPSRWSVRVPMVLAGVITICLTWMWTRRVAGTRAAAFSVALLSTDAIFIVTNTFDWGPVALQHVLLMAGLLPVTIWLQRDERSNLKWLALGFFLWGLGLWDKALFIWPLVGLAVATLCCYPRELRRHLRFAPLTIALVSLLLGALPLLCYNIERRGETVSTNAKVSIREVPAKVRELRGTLDGSVLLGPLVATEAGPIAQSPNTLVERLSVGIQRQFGAHTHNWMLPAIVLSFVCLLFLLRTPRSRVLLFVLVAAAVTWLQMAANFGTGSSAHHVILLWPFPCIFVGVALAGISERAPKLVSRAVIGVVALLVCGNLLTTNEYLADLILNGCRGGWTDASYRLAGAVYRYRSGRIGIVDWGYINPLRVMYEGDLRITELITPEDRAQLPKIVGSPDFVLIRHTDENQILPGVNGQLREAAAALGYSEQVERTVHDNQGRAIFEIFRFVKAP